MDKSDGNGWTNDSDDLLSKIKNNFCGNFISDAYSLDWDNVDNEEDLMESWQELVDVEYKNMHIWTFHVLCMK